jgi:ABC-type multidrug transport system, ATPase and permease components
LKTNEQLKLLWQLVVPYPRDLIKSLGAVLLTASTVLGMGFGIRTLVDQGFSQEDLQLLSFSAIGLIVLSLVLAVSAYIRTSTTAWLAERVVNDLRQRVFAHIINLRIEVYEHTRLGDLISRLAADADQVRSFISGSAGIAIRVILQIIGGTTLLILSSPKLTTIVFCVIPFVLIPIIAFGRKVKALTNHVQAIEGQALSFAEERLGSLELVKSYLCEQQSIVHFTEQLKKKMYAVARRTHYRSLLISLVIGLVFSSIALILWVGARDVMDGWLTAGQLSSFVFYAIIVAGSFNNLAEIISEFNTTSGALSRITEIFGFATESLEAGNALGSSFTTLQFKQVHFTYPSRAENTIFHNLSFQVTRGQKIAIVGPSGVGKSTIFKLLLRFYRPNSGQICINGHDIADLALQDLRQLFALVPQETVIYNTSIYDNIAFGAAQTPLKADVYKAGQLAKVNEFTKKFKTGYQTLVGEKGIRLSGGQRQRIALARAILSDAPIFLLDEATNALDSESERIIQAALKQILQQKTALIIAHRLSTVLEADQIIVLNSGGIEAMGTHQELLKRSTLYQDLAKQQFIDTLEEHHASSKRA